VASFYIVKNSPYYMIRIYDKFEKDPRKRRKSFSSKIKVTDSDRAKFLKGGMKYQGNNEIKNLINSLIAGYVDTKIEKMLKIHLHPGVEFLEGVKEYYSKHPDLAQSTIKLKEAAAGYFIRAAGNKSINLYTYRDYDKFLKLLSGLSQATINLHTSHLSPMFNFFVKQKYCAENIIIVTAPQKGNPKPIPETDRKTIFRYYDRKKPEYHAWLIYMFYYTGIRTSSALNLTVDRISLDLNLIEFTNLKKRKAQRRNFFFPIHPELKPILKKILSHKNYTPGERLFYWFGENEHPKFFDRDMRKLLKDGKIKRKYSLSDWRDTFSSYLANNKVHSSHLQKLLDHTDIRTTEEYYTQLEALTLFNIIKGIKFK